MRDTLWGRFRYFFKKLVYASKKHRGALLKKVLGRVFFFYKNKWDTFNYIIFFDKNNLKIVFSQEYSFIDFSCGKIQWSGTLVQRYNQVALQLSQMGGLVFAGSLPQIDNVRFIKKINDSLYVVNPFIKPLVKDLENLAKKQNKSVLVRIQSTDFSVSFAEVEHFKNLGFKVLYEYIDPFHEDISGPIPDSVLQRHNKILNDEDIYVCASAKALYNDLPKNRNRAFLCQNGVIPSHWKSSPANKELPQEMQRRLEIIKSKKLPVIGYHGALARWINYDLLTRIADTNKYSLLLIGYEYDNSLAESGLLTKKNITFLGPVEYEILPSITSLYDISIIPFNFEKFADGVSPIKLFEYMAIGRPIVGTFNSEISQYQSCLTARDSSEFLLKLEDAIQLSDDAEYKSILETECELNSWKSRCKAILENCDIY